MSDLSDNNSFEQWVADGSKDMYTRGLEAAKASLGDYQLPNMDPAIDEAITAFIAKRESEIVDTLE